MDHDINRDHQIRKGQRLPFPPEVFLEICSLLSPSEARSLRLCCKALADVGACYGFRDITFCVNKPDFDMLRAFSCHPIISKNIRKLAYVTGTLVRPTHPLYYSPQEYADFSASYPIAQQVKGSKQNWLPNGVFDNLPISVEDLQENYHHYLSTAHEQFLMVDRKEDFALFKEVLPKLTSLEEISIRHMPYNLSYHSPFFAPTEPPLYELPVQAVMYGLSGSGLRLRQLEVENLLPSILNTAFLQQISPACKYLESVILEIEEDTEVYDEVHRVESIFEKSRRAKETGALAKFLKALPSLERLNVTWVEDDYEIRYPLRDLIYPDSRWTNLRDINLYQIVAQRQELIAFFVRHRLTLERVAMGSCDLGTSSCIILLWQMKELLNLKDIHIYEKMEGMFEEGEDNTGFTYAPNPHADPLGQEWWFGDPPDPECLGTMVADWFLRDAPCPLLPGIQYLEHPLLASSETESDID